MTNQEIIPRKIHYCWFGRHEMNALSKRCLESWRVHLNDWTFVLWNEDSIPDNLPQVKALLEKKQYAFASDYIRNYAIYTQGGLYLDTDVEVIRSLSPLLFDRQFLGYQAPLQPTNGVCGGVCGASFFKACLEEMDKHYAQTDKVILSPETCAKVLKAQSFPDMTIHPQHIFYPYNPYDENQPVKQLMFSDIRPDTLCIHHWAKSWSFPLYQEITRKIRRRLKKILFSFNK